MKIIVRSVRTNLMYRNDENRQPNICFVRFVYGSERFIEKDFTFGQKATKLDKDSSLEPSLLRNCGPLTLNFFEN
jgi:hypothetical protein